MITVPAGVRIDLACGATDMRRYVEYTIMQSPRNSARSEPGTGLANLAAEQELEQAKAAKRPKARKRRLGHASSRRRC